MQNTLPLPQTHETDLPLGGHVFHGSAIVKIFGRERDEKTGAVASYWVVVNEGTKFEKRYPVAAKELRG